MKKLFYLALILTAASNLLAGQMENSIISSGAADANLKPGYIITDGGSPVNTLRLQGGDNINAAVPITEFPASVTGTTTGYINDYDEICPFDANAPDVVYSFTPEANMAIRMSLCQSDFDTKIYVYENAYTPGSPVACNEDACGPDGYRSELNEVNLNAGSTYFIVIDGYASSSGNYILELTFPPIIPPQCQLECPPDAMIEDEPFCYDEFDDIYNGGCQEDLVVWDTISPGITVCGTSGNYLYQGMQYRDSDWFEFGIEWESQVHLEGVGEFPLLMVLLRQGQNQPCNDFQIIGYGSAPICTTAYIDTILPAGRYWAWIGPSAFEGIQCGSDYQLTLQTTPTEYCLFTPGDANGNGSFNGLDVNYLVQYLKGWYVAPFITCNCPPVGEVKVGADANGDCSTNGLDISYMVNALKQIGPWPVGCQLCPPGN